MTVLTQAVAAAYVQSVARLYPQGVHLVAGFREDVLTIELQNRSNKPIYFWHGWAYENLAAQAAGQALPLNPSDWTPQQISNFTSFIQLYGETVEAGGALKPNVAQRLQLYSYVGGQGGGAEAHVKFGSPRRPLDI